MRSVVSGRRPASRAHAFMQTMRRPESVPSLTCSRAELMALLAARSLPAYMDNLAARSLPAYEAVLALEEQLAGFEGGGVRLGAYRML